MLQMEVKQAGQSSMLANPAKLASIAPKINKLAAREFKASPCCCPADPDGCQSCAAYALQQDV